MRTCVLSVLALAASCNDKVKVQSSHTQAELGLTSSSESTFGPGTSMLWAYYGKHFGRCYSWFGDDDGPDSPTYKNSLKNPSDVASSYSECTTDARRPSTPCQWRWSPAPPNDSCPQFHFQTENLSPDNRLASAQYSPRGFLFAVNRPPEKPTEFRIYNSAQPVPADELDAVCGTKEALPQQELSLSFFGLPVGNHILGKAASSSSQVLNIPYMIKEMKSLSIYYSVKGAVKPSQCNPELKRVSIFKPSILFDLYPPGTDFATTVNQSTRVAQYAIIIDHFVDPPTKSKYEAFPEISLYNSCVNSSFPDKRACTVHVKLDELIKLKYAKSNGKEDDGFESYSIDVLGLLKRYHDNLPRTYTTSSGETATIPQFFPDYYDETVTLSDGTTKFLKGNDFGSSTIRVLQFIGTQTGGFTNVTLRNINMTMGRCTDSTGAQSACPGVFPAPPAPFPEVPAN